MQSICSMPSEFLALAVTCSLWFSALRWVSLVKVPQCHRCSSGAVDVCLCRLSWIPVLTYSSWQTDLFVFFCPLTKNVLFGNYCLLPSRGVCAPYVIHVTTVAPVNRIFSFWYYPTPSTALELRWATCEQCSSCSHALWSPCTQVVGCSFACYLALSLQCLSWVWTVIPCCLTPFLLWKFPGICCLYLMGWSSIQLFFWSPGTL